VSRRRSIFGSPWIPAALVVVFGAELHADDVSPADFESDEEVVALPPARDPERPRGVLHTAGLERASWSNSGARAGRQPEIDRRIEPVAHRVSPTIQALEYAAVGEGAIEPVLIGPPAKISPRVRGEYQTAGVGNDRDFAHVAGMLPIWQSNHDSMRAANFLEAGLLYFEDSHLGGSVDWATRFYLGGIEVVPGIYLGYDYRETEWDRYHQVALGGDMLSSCAESRMNLYIPIASGRTLLGVRQTLTQIGSFRLPAIGSSYESVMWGGDYESGYRLLPLGRSGLWGFLGGYYFQGGGNDQVWGGKARIELRVRDWLRATAEYQLDTVFGANTVFGGEIIFPGTRPRGSGSDGYLTDRIGEPIRRWRTLTIRRYEDVRVP
jgi:hypothetical protein